MIYVWYIFVFLSGLLIGLWAESKWWANKSMNDFVMITQLAQERDRLKNENEILKNRYNSSIKEDPEDDA